MSKSQVMCVGCDNPAGKQDAESDGFCEECIAFATDRVTPVAAQAGDEPMPDLAAAIKGLKCTPPDYRNYAMDAEQRGYHKDGFRDGFKAAISAAATLATQVSPRATADVERVATECMEALAIGYVEFDEDLNENVCADCSTPTGSEWGDHTPDCLVVRARAAIATTKPGA